MYFSFKRNKSTREGEDNILIQKTRNNMRYNYFCVGTQNFLLAHAKIKALGHPENQVPIE